MAPTSTGFRPEAIAEVSTDRSTERSHQEADSQRREGQ